MQRVSALLPSWDRSKSNTTSTNASAAAARRTAPLSLDKVFGWAEKITVPGSRISISTGSSPYAPPARYGKETYWPTTLDRECDKAARILKSFCSM